MKIKLQSTLNCSAEAAWEEVKKVSLLQYVASPLVKFFPHDPAVFPKYWKEHETSVVLFRVFGLIPLGKHALYFEKIDGKTRELQTREKSFLLHKWDHLISITEENGQTIYTDEVEFSSGVLTPLVWLFAQTFYRHRQRRWRRLAPMLKNKRTVVLSV
ncbi:MAG: hypothetical protein AAGD96_31090 [Chloroflexota bacterium]